MALHKGVSYPVGKVELLNLYPLSFAEYLCAVGEKPLSDALLSKNFSIIDSLSQKYIYHLKNYYFVGGMPEVVEAFRNHTDYIEVRDLQKSILVQYKGDFGKHTDEKELVRINMIWDSIPMQLAKENKKILFWKN